MTTEFLWLRAFLTRTFSQSPYVFQVIEGQGFCIRMSLDFTVKLYQCYDVVYSMT